MEYEFFNLYASQSQLALEVGHNSIADWNIVVYDKKNKLLSDCDKPCIHVQDCDRSLVFAKAYVELANYLSEHRGGY